MIDLAARPPSSGTCVAFLVGTAAWADGFLIQGKRWVTTIQAAVGGRPRVAVGTLSANFASVATQIDTFSRDGSRPDTQISTAVLDQNLGGLRGCTLVFVTHGLEPIA